MTVQRLVYHLYANFLVGPSLWYKQLIDELDSGKIGSDASFLGRRAVVERPPPPFKFFILPIMRQSLPGLDGIHASMNELTSSPEAWLGYMYYASARMMLESFSTLDAYMDWVSDILDESGNLSDIMSASETLRV